MSLSSDPRSLLFQSAMRLLTTLGYGGLTLSALAKNSGMTKQLVYYYIKDTDDVLLWIAKEWSETGQRITIETLAKHEYSGIYRVLSIADGLFEWVKQYPDLSRTGMALMQFAPQVPSLAKFMNERRLAGLNRILEIISTNKTGSKKKLYEYAESLHAILYGHYLYHCVGQNNLDFERLQVFCKLSLKNQLDKIQESFR